MAAARVFLFGSRDVWFVVGLPVFLYSQGWRYMEVAGFIASWTTGYGLVQAIAPSVIRRSLDGLSREVPEARLWGAVLTAIPFVLALVLGAAHVARLDLVVTVGLGIFGFAFAVISSLHSYLIRLCGFRKSGGGCRLLLRGQCRRPAHRHPALGCARPGRRPCCLSLGLDRDAGALPRHHLPAAVGCQRATGAGLDR
jgi:hypothetical protein